MQHITDLLDHYGYIVLFTGLLLELIALPTPGELLMSYCGFLVYQGKLNWAVSILVSTTGSAIGITASYFLGTILGKTFFTKYGSYFHMGPEKLEKVSGWFDRYGNKLLVVAYYVPGVRHITGYFSGITKIPFKKFAYNAYLGAFIWTGSFISLGKVLGPQWESFHSSIKRYLMIGGLIAAVAVFAYYIYKNHRSRMIDFTLLLLKNTVKTYHSLGRVKIMVSGVAVSFLGLVVLVAVLAEDYMANEFTRFDKVTGFLTESILKDNWVGVAKFFMHITSVTALICLAILTLIWILLRGRNKFLEIRFLFIALLGGQLLQEGLGLVYHRLGPWALNFLENVKNTFPSEQTYMAIVSYGFAAYMVLRHNGQSCLRPLVLMALLIICFFTGLSEIRLQTQLPSDVIAGYIFGGVWLSLNIVLLEIFRVLPQVQNTKNTEEGNLL